MCALLSPDNCTLYSVLSGVTIEAEAGMTIYGQCWGQVKSAQCTAPLMNARYVFVWMMCCSCYYSTVVTVHVSLLGEPWAVFLQYTAWQPVSSSAGLYVLLLDSPEWPVVWPTSRRGHSRFWCYSDRHGAYGLTLSVIRPPVLITVSGALIPQCIGLSQFNEDIDENSVPVREFSLTACPLS